ncbi:MAG: 50S ribosomal protein L4 [Desulfuromonadaceae bacterium]|nr:50S ribosomal protein L4 [Desulfuromonadaceae bacterium]
MAKISIYDINKNQVSEKEIADSVFSGEIKSYLVHDMVRYQLAARRQGTVANKNRSAVRGGGKKPYKQKGTGNARQGCIRAPHYVGGGVAFAATGNENYAIKLNRKVRKAALKSALAFKLQQEKLLVFDSLDQGKVSTKEFAAFLKRLGIASALVVISEDNSNIVLSARNIPNVKVVRTEGVNVFDLLKYKNLLMTEEAVFQLEGALSR